MLQAIISPAKQMTVSTDTFLPQSISPFPAKTARLIEELRELELREGPSALKALWRVSDKLLAENVERLHAFVPVADKQELDDPRVARLVSPAIFSYTGIQFRSMAPEVMDCDELEWLQKHLWVLSGLYGCVRPFDAVEPYRLEMGAKLAVDGARDLYAFWGDLLARAICADGPVCVVNLASAEYAKAVLPHLPADSHATTCIFGEELRGGKPVQRATASKIARGSMVRWMAERGVKDACELTRFDVGYAYCPELSHEGRDRAGRSTQTLVFMKRAQA